MVPFFHQENMSDFKNVANEIGELVTEKNKAYGNSFEKCGEIIKVLYPNGIRPDQYQDALAITRVLDKMFRIANFKESNKDPMGENPWKDIAGYGIIMTTSGLSDKEENHSVIATSEKEIEKKLLLEQVK